MTVPYIFYLTILTALKKHLQSSFQSIAVTLRQYKYFLVWVTYLCETLYVCYVYNKFTLTHMLLYLMMEPTITTMPPSIPNTEAMAAEIVVRAVTSSENIIHS